MGGIKRQESYGKLRQSVPGTQYYSACMVGVGLRLWASLAVPYTRSILRKLGQEDRIKTSKTSMASGVWMSNPQKQAAIKVLISEGQEPLEG